MKRTKSTYLVLVAVLLTPIAANAVVIEIEGAGTLDGFWDITAVQGSRIDTVFQATLADQVWFGDQVLARTFATACFTCTGTDINYGVFGAFFNFENTSSALGYAYYVFQDGVNSITGGSATNFYAVAERASVPEPGTLTLFGLGLAGMRLARRKRKV